MTPSVNGSESSLPADHRTCPLWINQNPKDVDGFVGKCYYRITYIGSIFDLDCCAMVFIYALVQLYENRGKGGAVTHGMRYVRGQYAVFADVDSISRFLDLGKLVEALKKIKHM